MPINRMDILLLMHIEEGPDIPPYYGMPLRHGNTVDHVSGMN